MTRYLLGKFCFYAVLFGAAVLCSSMVCAQKVSKPMNITSIPGGFFIEWASPVELAAIHLDKRLTGPLEIVFDVPTVEYFKNIDSKPQPGTNPEIVTALADYWIVRGKPDRAIPLYEDSLARGNLDETRAFVFQNNLSMLYSQAGEHTKALEIVDNALETKKENVTLLDTKGLIFLNAGKPTEAVEPLQRAVELSCQHPLYCLHLSYALYKDGRTTMARSSFEKASEQLRPLVPTMGKNDKGMFDVLQSSFAPDNN